MKKTIEFRKECESCNGTGLYVGFSEGKGAAVVCHKCEGRGFINEKIEYIIFEKRKMRYGIKRVFKANPGIGISTRNHILEDFGGISYSAWQEGLPFGPGTEMRKFTCPAWYYQCVDSRKKPEWKECIGCGSFSDCKHFKDKERCWKKWDGKFGGKNEKKKSL